MPLWVVAQTDKFAVRDHCKDMCQGMDHKSIFIHWQQMSYKQMKGKSSGQLCLSSAEMGSPSCSWSNSNASSSAASRAPREQGRYKLCSTCWKCPPRCGSSFSLIQTKLWPDSLQSFLSFTHTMGKAMTKLNEAEIHSISFPLQEPYKPLWHCWKMEVVQIFPPVETLDLFWHCKHHPQWYPSKEGFEVFKQLGPKMGSSKLCLADDYSQRMTSAEDYRYRFLCWSFLNIQSSAYRDAYSVSDKTHTSGKNHPPNYRSRKSLHLENTSKVIESNQMDSKMLSMTDVSTFKLLTPLSSLTSAVE